MFKQKKYYVTTPIYYINGEPHLGSAYTTLSADILARWHRLLGQDVFFLTGTDENSSKNIEAAEKAGEKDIQKYLDKMSATWQLVWNSLDITHNDFIRTTEKRHIKSVNKFFEKVYSKGDIYKSKYSGYYCSGCESFVKESDLKEGKCPWHNIPPQKIDEENYFFKLKKYKDKLLKHIDENPNFIQPAERKNEIINYISYHLEDISISRLSSQVKEKWGIPLPIDKNQVIYVWFDALINYLSGLDYGEEGERFKKYWPADLHLVGKDIIKFHCALWPAMLMSAELPLPKHIFAHGFFTVKGQKISKSLGNAIDPLELVRKYGLDSLRYFLFREIPFGQDGDFSMERLEKRYNSDLANGIGNLASRVLSMTEKYYQGKTPRKIKENIDFFWQKFIQEMEELKFNEALMTVWDLIKSCDSFINNEEPWLLAKKDKKRLSFVLYLLLEKMRNIAWMIMPFMPQTAENIFQQLGFSLSDIYQTPFSEAIKWGGMKEGQKIKKGNPLFPRLSNS